MLAVALSPLVLFPVGCVRRTTVSNALTPTHSPTSPQRASPLERQVLNATDLGEGDFAIKALRDRVSANPQDLSARIALAQHYQTQGFPEVALEHLRLACERAPDSAVAHLELARLLRKQGQTAEAVKTLERLVSRPAFQQKPDVEVWAWLGLFRDETSDWRGGEKAHREALALVPERDDLHNNLGFCLLEQGRKGDAAAEFREALRLNRHSVIARNNLGIALASSPKDAVLNWQSVSDPASAHNNMAAVLIEAGKYGDARKEIGLALGYNQQHPAALNNLRLLAQLDGKPAEYQSTSSPSRWTRFRATWRRLWAENAEEDRSQTESGKALASR